MNTLNIPNRLGQALVKLYNAFHNNNLHPEDCTVCAVGNILDKKDFWKHLSDDHGSLKLNYIGTVHQNLGRRFNGYTPQELLQIENVFLKACGYKVPLHYKDNKPKKPTDKEVLFNGLCAVVGLLCKMDDIPNVMEYFRSFEYRNSNNLELIN